MREDDPVLLVIDALHACAVPFMMVGSYSSNRYGIPRNTVDADFVIELGDAPVGPIAERLSPQFDLDPQMSFETVTFHLRWKFTHRATGFIVEMFLLVSDEFDQQRFHRRRPENIWGRVVWFQTPEDVIVNKLRWARRKDRQDILDVMKVQGANLDWPYIEKWSESFNRTKLLGKLRLESESPPGSMAEDDD